MSDRIGCDLDGTYLSGFRPPESDYVFITGRKVDDWTRTVEQVGSDRPLYLRPLWFPGSSPHWKAAMIQWLRITKFYEDEPGQAQEIRRRCPDCRVVMVKNGQIVGDAP
jgi:hypothetical protein